MEYKLTKKANYKIFTFFDTKDILTYFVDHKSCIKFLKKYPNVYTSMKKFTGSSGLKKRYNKFLTFKQTHEDDLGGTPRKLSSPAFGEKTFYDFDFGDVSGHWPEVFQYVCFESDIKNVLKQNIKENVDKYIEQKFKI
jgi:hypothetical protein